MTTMAAPTTSVMLTRSPRTSQAAAMPATGIRADMNKRRVTLLDIAKEAGVHVTTVSLALKCHPRIPGETQERVRRIADELGYRPDPMLSSLVAYRTHKRPAAFHGTLAWLVSSAEGFNWQEVPHFLKHLYRNTITRKKYRARNFLAFQNRC